MEKQESIVKSINNKLLLQDYHWEKLKGWSTTFTFNPTPLMMMTIKRYVHQYNKCSKYCDHLFDIVHTYRRVSQTL